MDGFDGCEYRFTGKHRDGSTGLSYFNARYYDPVIGRFITSDPIKSGVNWYVYCSNNPLKRVDKDGLDDFVVGFLNVVESFVNIWIDFGELQAERAFHESWKGKIVAPELYKVSYEGMKESFRTARAETKKSFTIAKMEALFNNFAMEGGYSLNIDFLSSSQMPENALGKTSIIGKQISILIDSEQSLKEIGITFWHELTEAAEMFEHPEILQLELIHQIGDFDIFGELLFDEFGIPESGDLFNEIIDAELGF